MNKKIYVGLVIFVMAILSASAYAIQQDKEVEITVYNPYRFDVSARIKCNWDNKKGNFLYDKEVLVPGKKHNIITVSKIYTKCEIWPHVEW